MRSTPLVLRLTAALAAALPLACTGGGVDTDTTASTSMTASSSSGSGDSKTATSSKTSAEGSASATASTSADTDTTADMTVSTGDTSGCGFVCADVPIDPEHCNYFDDLCPEDTKCTFDGELSQSHCVDIVRQPKQEGEDCEAEEFLADDDCDDHLLCLEGKCVPFCGVEDDFDCGPKYVCTFCQECALGICIPGCDPLINDCPDGDLCVPDAGDFICVPDASGEEGQYGDPCEYLNACDPGHFCAGSDLVPDCMAPGCCTPFCDLSDPECPDEALDCTPWYEEGETPPDYEDVGACVLPQP